MVGSRPSPNCDACFATFHLLSCCNSLGNCRAALLVTLAEQLACNGALTRSVLYQLSCCRQDASLLCRPASYRDIRHDERPRLCRGHSSCRMSHPFIPLGAPVSLCLGRLLHRLTQLFNLDQPPIVRPWLALGRGGGAMHCVAVQRMKIRFMTNFMQIFVKNRTFLPYTAIYNSL